MNEVVETQKQIAVTPVDLLRLALESGADLDRLERLMDLQAKWEAGQARKSYYAAITEFKSKPIVINKDKHVKFTTQKGTTEYSHASLAEVVDAVVVEMAKAGLSHGWTVAQDGKTVVVTCVITHSSGHSESVALTALWDESGTKNGIQAMASTTTYLSRHTLLLAVGLASRDMVDDDGAGAGPELKDAKDGRSEARDRLYNIIKQYAEKGTASLKDAWQKAPWLTDKEGPERVNQAIKDRELIGDWLDALKGIARKADEAAATPVEPKTETTSV